MSHRAFGITSHAPDFNNRDFDRPAREPKYDPLEDAFGDTFWGPNWQLDGVLDKSGGKHFFWRCYATKPCKVLVDYYIVQPNPIEFGEYSVDEAISNMRAAAIAKAEKIAKQLGAYNAAHPSEMYGLISVIGSDVVTKDEVERACTGEFVGVT